MSIRPRTKHLLVLAAITTLAACGGDSTPAPTTTPTPEPQTPVISEKWQSRRLLIAATAETDQNTPTIGNGIVLDDAGNATMLYATRSNTQGMASSVYVIRGKVNAGGVATWSISLLLEESENSHSRFIVGSITGSLNIIVT